MKKYLCIAVVLLMLVGSFGVTGTAFADDMTTVSGIINEVYITDGIGDSVQCLILTLDEEKTFNVCDEMGETVSMSATEIQIVSTDYTSDMNGKRITVSGNDLMTGLTFYFIRPIVMADAKITVQESSQNDSETASSVSLIERIKTSYAQILNTVSADAAQNFEDPCYYVYDINKDNLPELIIKRGTCEADYRYDVYTYTDYEAVYIGKLPGGHISVCGINESGILLYHAHMGYEMIFEGTMDGNKLSHKTIYEEDCNSKEYEYDGNIGKFREGAGYLQRCPNLNDYSLLNQYFEAVPVSEDISVKINGEKIVLEQLPIMINDRTLIPFRAVFEALGADVTWDENTNSAVGGLDGKKVEFPVGQSIYYVDGEKHEMDIETYINEAQGRTYIPVRYAAESLGFSVEWIENERLIEIQK